LANVDPAESNYPAAGACAHAIGLVGTVALRTLDYVPQPRCLIIRHDQLLRVVNGLNVPLTAKLGTHMHVTLRPQQGSTFPRPIGAYLAPGVHTLHFTPTSAASIWVDATCAKSGGQCSSATATP
jgi:hypothetical protein